MTIKTIPVNTLVAIGRFLEMDRKTVVLAIALAFSAWLSFAIATTFDVQNAYWAAMPAWVVAQASRGLLLERAVFRVVGTLIGAAAGFALVHLPAHPYVQLLLLGGWIALNAGLTHILRGVHGYGALLSGITAAIVVIPAVLTPSGSLDLAVARVECTLIGVVVVTLVMGLLTPGSPRRAFYARVRGVAGDAVAYAASILREGADDDESDERRILSEISRLESSARLTLAGSLAGYRRLRAVDALMVGSLSIMAAALALMRGSRAAQPQYIDLSQRMDRIAAHLHSDNTHRIGNVRIADHDAEPSRLSIALAQILQADAELHTPSGAEARSFETRLADLAPHREWYVARRTGLAAGAATFMASALGYWSGWPPIALAALGVCIFAMVLGSMALPQKIAPQLLAGVIAGIAVAIFYRFTVQPAIATLSDLLLTIAPFLLLGGFVRMYPRTAIAGVDGNMCFLLASQAGNLPAAAAVVWGDGLALASAAALVAGTFILLPRRSTRQATDVAALIRRDLRRMINSAPASDSREWQARASRQILRLALHLGRAPELGNRWPNGLLAALNVGYAITRLHEAAVTDATVAQTKARALEVLQGFSNNPFGTARALRSLAGADNAPLHQVLRELADVLASAAGLLMFGAAEQRPPDR